MELDKNLRYMLLRFIQAKIANPASANQEGPDPRLNQVSENKVYIPMGNTTYLHEVWGITSAEHFPISWDRTTCWYPYGKSIQKYPVGLGHYAGKI